MRFLFPRLDEKHKLLGNFEKTLKYFDENYIEKLNFLFLFAIEKLLLKIELSETTPFLYNDFFGFGWISPFPLATPLLEMAFYSGQSSELNFQENLGEAKEKIVEKRKISQSFSSVIIRARWG